MGLIASGTEIQSVTSGEIYTFANGGRWEIVSDLEGGVVSIEQRKDGSSSWVTTATIESNSVDKLFMKNQEYKFTFSSPIVVYLSKFTV